MRWSGSPDATEDQIEAGRAELNRLYDGFLAKYGYLNDPTNRRIFLDDTESALLLALEFDYDRGVSKAVAEREEIEPRAPSAVAGRHLQAPRDVPTSGQHQGIERQGRAAGQPELQGQARSGLHGVAVRQAAVRDPGRAKADPGSKAA